MFNSLTIVLSGSAGQGLKTIETLLVNSIKTTYNIFSTTEVMSRIRGGNNTVELRVGEEDIYTYKDKIDILFLLNSNAFYRLTDRITPDTIIFGEEDALTLEEKETLSATFVPINISELATTAGSIIFSNTIILGFICGLLALNESDVNAVISRKFASKKATILSGNLAAMHLGYMEGQAVTIPFKAEKTDAHKNSKVVNGNEAIGIGALAGGINYIASYPMSPGTGVLEYLAQKGNDFNIVVEQAEDEIAAINMCIGAWYAGARSLVTTSGGGFALMEEGVSLAGITETPIVIHIAQRPGPGTGLPTRTEQADLNLAVYSGHGEFPRIVLAPGSLEDGILLTQQAFYLADKYQVPVFILSDQYYLDSKAPLKEILLPSYPLVPHTVTSTPDYNRYQLTDSPLSPRSYPGNGTGFVKCDSDEHDEEGTITEDFNVRITMNDKRLSKETLILEEYIAPAFFGPDDYDLLVIGWGSTYGVLRESILSHPDEKTALLHIKQVFPLSETIKNYTSKAKKILVVENNAMGQLNNLLKLHLDVVDTITYLKYNGVPFTIEEIDAKIKEVQYESTNITL